MPCEDVTEVLQLVLDPDDRLTSYSLIKQTCGQAVGERALLAAELAGRSCGEILAVSAQELLDSLQPEDDVLEFLSLKHLFAVQSALQVYLGQEPGGAGEPAAVGSVLYGPEGAEIQVRLRVDILAERIKSCGACKGCGTKKRKPQEAAP